MMKETAKRRRSKEEIKEQEQAEAAKKLEIETKMARFAEMELQMVRMQEQLMNQQGVLDQATSLYDQGLIKQQSNGSWMAVRSIEEQQRVLKQREDDAKKEKQLNQEVNLEPPPSIDASRQRPGQQLELDESMQNQPDRPSSQASNNNAVNRPQSRRQAAQ